jgi:hypothetical protein
VRQHPVDQPRGGTFAADGPAVEEPRVVATLLDVWLRSIDHRDLPKRDKPGPA